MQIEIVQQEIKLEVVEIPTAEQSRDLSAIGQCEAAERLARQIAERDAADQAKVAEVLAVIADRISKCTERGDTYLCLEWAYRKNGIPYVDFETWNRLFSKYLRPVLESLGYRVYNHEYSRSWQNKSNKIGYATIHW